MGDKKLKRKVTQHQAEEGHSKPQKTKRFSSNTNKDSSEEPRPKKAKKEVEVNAGNGKRKSLAVKGGPQKAGFKGSKLGGKKGGKPGQFKKFSKGAKDADGE